ncbi:PDR/VanB family oxidoreductase [Glycomyces sp. YM15]|uniref:PDR/VanB family oxidoreductase n=1 Tax=Glycomyces sp. YM15 TaxID=2800446 RepID=UPI0019643D23|nr:PDR/VanB family oxidoreductase [Glycomyces sp. YM15]
MSTSADTAAREVEADLVVDAVRQESDGVVSLRLIAPGDRELPTWAPGAHVDLMLPNGAVRQYSLCGDPADRASWRLGILREPQSRGGSSFVHDSVKKGTVLRTRGPRNNFALADSPRYRFIAGGIGITPILPMIAAAHAAGADWTLHYGGRSRRSMAFLDELGAYGDRVTVLAADEVGLPDLDALLGSPEPDTLVYCCGPGGLLDAVEQRCAAWPAGALHLERFAAKEPASAADDAAFELLLQESGLNLTVPADKSVFEVVREAGVNVVGSCFEGVCGTCETGVVDGEVDHRDSVLSPAEREENEVMMICVSRCRSGRLTLEL